MSATDAQIDFVHDMYDRLFREGKFGVADNILATLHPACEPKDIVLSHLTATLPAKSKLPSRAAFVERCRDVLGDELLEGLE